MATKQESPAFEIISPPGPRPLEVIVRLETQKLIPAKMILSGLILCLTAGLFVAPATAQSEKEWDISALSSEIRDLTQKVSPAVVQIYTSSFGSLMGSTPQGAALFGSQQATGSGIILDSSGYILTNNHVVEGAKRVQVRLSAKALGQDGAIPSWKPAGTSWARRSSAPTRKPTWPS